MFPWYHWLHQELHEEHCLDNLHRASRVESGILDCSNTANDFSTETGGDGYFCALSSISRCLLWFECKMPPTGLNTWSLAGNTALKDC